MSPCHCVLCRSHRASNAIADAARTIAEAIADLGAAEEQRLDEDFEREGSLYYLLDEVEAVLAMPSGAMLPAARDRLRHALELSKPERKTTASVIVGPSKEETR